MTNRYSLSAGQWNSTAADKQDLNERVSRRAQAVVAIIDNALSEGAADVLRNWNRRLVAYRDSPREDEREMFRVLDEEGIVDEVRDAIYDDSDRALINQCASCQKSIRYSAGETHVPTVAVDLDGTLAEHNSEVFDPNFIDEPRANASRAMQLLKDQGFHVIVWTCRDNDSLIAEWLQKHQIPYDEINHNSEQDPTESPKIIADVYIDDRGIDASGDFLQAVTKGIEKVMEKDRRKHTERRAAFMKTLADGPSPWLTGQGTQLLSGFQTPDERSCYVVVDNDDTSPEPWSNPTMRIDGPSPGDTIDQYRDMLKKVATFALDIIQRMNLGRLTIDLSHVPPQFARHLTNILKNHLPDHDGNFVSGMIRMARKGEYEDVIRYQETDPPGHDVNAPENWVPYFGPQQGKGIINVVTAEVRYDVDMPGKSAQPVQVPPQQAEEKEQDPSSGQQPEQPAGPPPDWTEIDPTVGATSPQPDDAQESSGEYAIPDPSTNPEFRDWLIEGLDQLPPNVTIGQWTKVAIPQLRGMQVWQRGSVVQSSKQLINSKAFSKEDIAEAVEKIEEYRDDIDYEENDEDLPKNFRRLTPAERAKVERVAQIFGIRPGDIGDMKDVKRFLFRTSKLIGFNPGLVKGNLTDKMLAATDFLEGQRDNLDAVVRMAQAYGWKGGDRRELAHRARYAGLYLVEEARRYGLFPEGDTEQEKIASAIDFLHKREEQGQEARTAATKIITDLLNKLGGANGQMNPLKLAMIVVAFFIGYKMLRNMRRRSSWRLL